MSDLLIKFSPELLTFDLDIKNWELEYDDGLETAILISLFSDSRVADEDLEEGEFEKRGWWGDSIENEDRHTTGSLLWRVIRRGLARDEDLEEAREACLESLQWLLDDNIAADLSVETSYLNDNTMLIAIEIVRPTGEHINFRYNYVWEGRTGVIQQAYA